MKCTINYQIKLLFLCNFYYELCSDAVEHNRKPYRVAGAGRGSGLFVILDLEVESYVAATRPFYGCEIIVHDPNDFPQTSFSSTIIQPGYVGELMITPSLIESQEIIENVAINQRKCYLQDEVCFF
jgi:acid-sensing ion channel, other